MDVEQSGGTWLWQFSFQESKLQALGSRQEYVQPVVHYRLKPPGRYTSVRSWGLLEKLRFETIEESV